MEFEEMIRKNKKMSKEAKEKAIHSYYKKHPKKKILTTYDKLNTKQKVELEFMGIAQALGLKSKSKGARLM